MRAGADARADAAIQRACERAADADLLRLERVLIGMAAAQRSGDLDALSAADVEFHSLIIEVAGLTFLRNVWASLAGLVRVRTDQAIGRPSSAASYFLRHSVSSHRQLLEFIRQRDHTAGGLAVSGHILGVARRLRDEDHP